MFTTAGPTSTPRIKRSITTRLIMLATGTALGAALLIGATPAMAQEYPNPEGGSSATTTPSDPAQDNGLDATSVALGVLAGIALGGAGLSISRGAQRRRDHAATPYA
jgi:hypothetical protein